MVYCRMDASMSLGCMGTNLASYDAHTLSLNIQPVLCPLIVASILCVPICPTMGDDFLQSLCLPVAFLGRL